MSRTSSAKGAGFTLVEVLVALVVLSLGAIMLANSIGGSAKAYSRVDDKVRAWMVASDKLVELQVYQQFPPVGTSDTTEERFGQRWQIRTTVSNGPYPDTRRVDIDVGPVAAFGETSHYDWSQSSLLGKPHSSGSSAGDTASSGGGPDGNNPSPAGQDAGGG